MYAQGISGLNIQPHDKVLNIGCGTGYLSTVFAFLAGPRGTVHGLDVFPGVAASAQR
jgi:protein-L-isoaspartate O-methyltransferase